MWHSNMNGIFVEYSWMKIGIILRCHKMKRLFGCVMTGVFLWLCCMIVEEYMLECCMVECVWLECIACGAWWPPKMAQMGWKWILLDWWVVNSWKFLSTDRKFLVMVVWQSIYDFFGGFVCGSIVFKKFCNTKSAFSTFLFLNWFQLWLQILGGYDWGNFWDVVLEGIWDIFFHVWSILVIDSHLWALWPSFSGTTYLCKWGHLFESPSWHICSMGKSYWHIYERNVWAKIE